MSQSALAPHHGAKVIVGYYWTFEEFPQLAESWFERATQHEGSWWSDWVKWVAQYNGEKIPAHQPKQSIEPAPGSYVKAKAS